MYRLFQSSVIITNPIVILSTVSIIVVLAGSLITTIAAYASSTSNFNNTTTVITILTAESVYQSESMKLPPSFGSFIILIANEAHESWQDERHKLISDKNSYYIPKNLVVPQGNYTIKDTEYGATEGTISVTNEKSNGTSVVGGFYTPSHQVENNKDNDGGVHPGSLQYYRAEFPKNGFQILSEYNFTYAACDYCPGKYWPDNKTGNHTLIIYATEQPLSDALIKLKKIVRDNVYI